MEPIPLELIIEQKEITAQQNDQKRKKSILMDMLEDPSTVLSCLSHVKTKLMEQGQPPLEAYTL